jgi:hypothetical protein
MCVSLIRPFRRDRQSVAAGDHGRSAVGRSERPRDYLTGGRRRRGRGHSHGNHWRNQEQSRGLTDDGRQQLRDESTGDGPGGGGVGRALRTVCAWLCCCSGAGRPKSAAQP